MSDQKKRGKHKYLDNYAMNASGIYAYTGTYLKFDMPERQLKRVKITVAILTTAVAVLFVFAGTLNNAGSRVLYVVLPYAAALLPILFMISDAYKIGMCREPMTAKQYDHSVLQLKRSCVAAAIFFAISAIGDICFMIFSCGRADMPKELFYLIACLCMLAVTISLLRVQRSIQCAECGKTER